MRFRWLLICLVLLSSCDRPTSMPSPDPESGRTEVIAADRAFNELTQAKGLEGWMEFMTADAARVRKMGVPAVRGLPEIRQADADLFADPAIRLTWEPVDGGLFADGQHGFTTGRFKLLEKLDDGSESLRGEGAYVTWWRREPDGQWRVILDTGSPDPPPPPASD